MPTETQSPKPYPMFDCQRKSWAYTSSNLCQGDSRWRLVIMARNSNRKKKNQIIKKIRRRRRSERSNDEMAALLLFPFFLPYLSYERVYGNFEKLESVIARLWGVATGVMLRCRTVCTRSWQVDSNTHKKRRISEARDGQFWVPFPSRQQRRSNPYAFHTTRL